MANLIFPTGTSDMMEVSLLSWIHSVFTMHVRISTGYISVDKTYVHYVAMHVTWISVQLPAFHFMFKGNHLLRWATAKIYF